jgi:cytochrome c oxidase assembly factor CtaG
MSVYRDRFRAEQAAHFRRVLLMCLGLIAGVIAVGSGLAVLNFYLTGSLH